MPTPSEDGCKEEPAEARLIEKCCLRRVILVPFSPVPYFPDGVPRASGSDSGAGGLAGAGGGADALRVCAVREPAPWPERAREV